MEKAARKASKKLIRDFGELEKLQVSSKSLGNFVTNADITSEKEIKETLNYHFPDYGFIMEESGKIEGVDNNHVFIVDPIDGTTNFIHGIPYFCIVIAKLTYGEISDGIIFNPITNEFYWASKGKGSWLNNQRLRVSNRKKMDECIIGAGSIRQNPIFSKQIQNLKNQSTSIRSMGSAAIDLAYVASGKLDAFWEINLNIWDIASGIILITEAGGKISQSNGEIWSIDSNNILASNALIHEQMVDYLKIP